MNPLFVVIAAAGHDAEALLAAEALRHAAGQRPLAVEVRASGGVIGLHAADAAAQAGQLLIVGDAGTDDDADTDADASRFVQAAVERCSLREALDDPAGVLARCAAASPAASRTGESLGKRTGKRIVAVTSCPTGIAHTFMAAEGLQRGAAALGHAMRVETQGSVGALDALTPQEIAEADLVIIAADREVDLSRFTGKPLLRSGTKPAIRDGSGLITKALAEATVHGAAVGAAAGGAAPTPARTQGGGAYRHLMTGVSFMLPFVTAGGILIAMAFALGGIYVHDDAHQGTLGWTLFQIGAKGGFALMVPALAGYIAYSIADRPGIAPGMIGGMIASSMGAGFIGGIAAGFIAGYGVAFMAAHIRLPQALKGLLPMLILPVLGSLFTGLLMFYLVGAPVAELLQWLSAWLRGMQGASALLLGLLLGAMMAFDMGGPVNKAAYAFSTGMIASQVYTPMAAAMIAGMTPPLGLALATRLFADRFTREERGSAASAGVLGLAFVTEGAIPYAARDPLRTIPALVLGSAVAGAVSMLAGVELKVPHGGIFVAPIPNAVTHVAMYAVALVAGVVVTAIALRMFKRPAEAGL
ncbi:fructose-specific PTS transporter subunit EIIC [Delftia acidovorans]|uniref:PTS fructose transporter subunit IIC n=1 Tax=Delftia acidovorans TaxID=80866 RepID=UPI001EFDFA9B|nr:fructose-specific PTS transporter subunit EIIC [Delftia acidovorans]MCG8990664.1 fructose-specific PTS transporter subunit EIIC [Delftia acidovorans]